MAEQRRVYRVGTSIVVALPLRVRARLGVKRGDTVYWHVVRGGEAVLSTRATRRGGRPEGLALTQQLDAALADIARLRVRDEARDRALYAEGYHTGASVTAERLEAPHGPSARRHRRRETARILHIGAPTPTGTRAERRRTKHTSTPAGPCRVCGATFGDHPKPDHAWDTLPIGAPSPTQ